MPKLPGAGAIHPIVSLPAAAGAAVAGAVTQGGLPKIDLPKISLPELPKVTLPTLPKVELPKPARSGTGGGNIIDTIIDARDKSYEDSISHIGAGNVPRGGLQFAGTAAADVLLPMDLTDAVNKWTTGRGDEIDSELALWAAVDAVTLAAAPFTLGASYAAGRALKAAKLAKAAKIAESTKVGGEVAKSKVVTKAVGALTGAGKTSSTAKAAQQAKVTQQSKIIQQARQNYTKQFAKFQEATQKQQAKAAQQISKMASNLKAPKSKSVPTGATKGLGAGGDLAEAAVKAESRWSKVSKTLGKGAKATGLVGLGVGGGAIGLTMMGALGGPAPGPEEEEEELPQWLLDLLEGQGADGDLFGDDDWLPYNLTHPESGEDPWWSLPPDWPMLGEDFQFPDGIPWGDYQYPDEYGGYTDEDGNYPPGYPDFLGLEDYGQGLFGAAEEVPVVGGLFHEIRKRGLTIPALIGAVVVAVLLLRSKRGKKMVSGAKKKVSGATKSAKKAVAG
ncbi:MAG TPA: hypothetical protein PKV78_05375 [Methanoculleus thermophilus]|nr:hypothetical protein [Methanoculleus thermophilus]